MIERGHTFEDLIGKYTIDQVWKFYEKAQETKRNDIRDYAIAVRAAFHADKSEWRQFLKTMGVEVGRKVTRETVKQLKGFGKRRRVRCQ